MSDAIVFEDPPPDGRRSNPRGGTTPKYIGFVDALMDRPGVWAKLPSKFRYASGFTGAVKSLTRAGASFDDGQFEATSRALDDGHTHVWVRYNGPKP